VTCGLVVRHEVENVVGNVRYATVDIAVIASCVAADGFDAHRYVQCDVRHVGLSHSACYFVVTQHVQDLAQGWRAVHEGRDQGAAG
jgi:hypothetical protein